MIARFLAAGWGQAFSAVLQLLSLKLYTLWMDSEHFGLGMLGLGVVAFIDGLAAMAFAQVLAQLLKDHDTLRQRVGLALGLAVTYSSWVALVAAFALVLAWIWLGSSGLLICGIGAFALTATDGIRNASQIMAQLDRRFMLVSTWSAAEALAVICCTALALKHSQSNPAGLVVGLLCGRALVSVAFAPLALGSPGSWSIDWLRTRKALPEALRIGWHVALMAPIGWLGSFSDRFIVGAMNGLTEAGILAALTGVVMRPYAIVSMGLTNLYRPDLLDEAAGRAPLHFKPLQAWIKSALSIGLIGILSFTLLGPFLTNFLISFPTPDVNSSILLIIIAISQTFVLTTHAFDNRLLAEGRSQVLLLTQIFVLIVGLPLIALGATWFGVLGVALGRCINEGMKFLATWYALKSYRIVRSADWPH